MASLVCRLCLNDSKLINIFDNLLTNSDQLKKCILLGTGVEICHTDKVSTYICTLCSDIAIFLYKYRQNALANDKALKEFANQHYTEPFTDTKDVVLFNRKVLVELDDDEAPKMESEEKFVEETCEKRMKPPQTNFAVHPTIMHLIKTNPKLKIPNELLRYDIQPQIALNKNEVEEWQPPPPKRIVISENKPITPMERFKMKFPSINIMKISNSTENNGGNSNESNGRNMSDENNVGCTENPRKRKASATEEAPSVDRVAELPPMIKKRFNGIDENSVKVSKPMEYKFKSIDYKAKITESVVKITESKTKLSESKAKDSESQPKFSESKSTDSEPKPKFSESKPKNTESKPKVNESKTKITESKLKISESKSKVSETKIKEPNGTKSKSKKRVRVSDHESVKPEKTLPKLKISLRKSSESINDSPTVSVMEAVTSDIQKPVQKPVTTYLPQSTFIAPSPSLVSSASGKTNTAESDTERIAPKKLSNRRKTLVESDTLTSSIFIAPLPSLVSNAGSKTDTSESDTERISPKKLSNRRKMLFDSDTEDSDHDSIGANDLIIDDLVDDPLSDVPLADDAISNNNIFDDRPPDDTVLDALLDTFEEEMALHCVHCNRMFGSVFQLKCHERIHKNCTICKAVFRSHEALRHHHTEVCFKVVIRNPPNVQLTRVDEEPEFLKQYPSVFAKQTESDKETDSNILCISDDEDDEVILIEDTGDLPTAGLDVAQNREYQQITNVFKKYKDLKFQAPTKDRHTEMKPQMHVGFNSKGQIVLENMFPELKYYRVPVELIAKSSSFAYISFNEKQPKGEELYNWSQEPVISLTDKSLLSTLLKGDSKKIKDMAKKGLKATKQTTLHSYRKISEKPTVTTSVSINATHSTPINMNTSNLTQVTTNTSTLNLNMTPVNMPNLTMPVTGGTSNFITPPVSNNLPLIAPANIITSNLTPIMANAQIRTPININMQNVTTPVNISNLEIPLMTNTSNLITTPVMANTLNLIATPVNRNLTTPVNVTNTPIPVIEHTSNLITATPPNRNMSTIPAHVNTSNLTTVMTNINYLTSTFVNRNMSNFTTPTIPANTSNFTTPTMSVNTSNFTTPTMLVNTSNFATPTMPTNTSNFTTPTMSVNTSNFTTPTMLVNTSNFATPTMPTNTSNFTTPTMSVNTSNFTTPTMLANTSNFTTPAMPTTTSNFAIPAIPTNTSNLMTKPAHKYTSSSPTSTLTNQAAISRTISDEIIDLFDDAVPSTSGVNNSYVQQHGGKENNLSLRVKTPWELNNINA